MKNIPRRIVTGIKDGKSVITEDLSVENVVEHLPGLFISDIWSTQQTPASLGDEVKSRTLSFRKRQKMGLIFVMWSFRQIKI